MSDHALTFGSLFAGGGMMDLGLERAGLNCVFQCEIDDYARRVLAKHWPDVTRWRDIRTFLPDTASERRGSWGPGRIAARRQRRALSPWVAGWRVDVVAGGFPCQDLSYAGRGAGLHGKRSGLWWEAARVIRTLRPRYVLLENVAALLTRGLDAVLGTLDSLGYVGESHCLPAAYVGAPHIRDRVFILGYADFPRANPFAEAGGSRGAAGQPGGEPGHVADADSCGGDPGAERAGWQAGADAGERGGGCRLDLRPRGDRETLADACSLQPERWRVDGILAGSPRTSEGDREERQRDGDAAEHRGATLADADRPRQWQPGEGVAEVGGWPGYGCTPDRLAEFRGRVGVHWHADPADDPES